MWTCDTCRGAIQAAADGWVEWITVPVDVRAGLYRARDLRLVHKRGCQFNERKENAIDGGIVGDSALSDFLGADGLVYLLDLLSRDEIPRDQVVTLIQRLHVPGYEAARPHFQAAISEGVIEPNLAPGFYSQDDINSVIRWSQGRA